MLLLAQPKRNKWLAFAGSVGMWFRHQTPVSSWVQIPTEPTFVLCLSETSNHRLVGKLIVSIQKCHISTRLKRNSLSGTTETKLRLSAQVRRSAFLPTTGSVLSRHERSTVLSFGSRVTKCPLSLGAECSALLGMSIAYCSLLAKAKRSALSLHG